MKFRISIRRIIQGICLLLFLALLFFVVKQQEIDYISQNQSLPSQVKLFLQLDPLVGVTSAIASRMFNVSLAFAAVSLLACLVVPRWFCGYACPMGTLIDIFDFLITNRFKRFRPKPAAWWRSLRFYILGIILIASTFGVLLSGFLAAIPVITRGLVYIFFPITAQNPPAHFDATQIISITLFIVILLLGFIRPRFWCAYLCPSGALLGLAGILRINKRCVDATCIECGKCIKACSFDAIAPDFSVNPVACASCKSCQNVCPKHSIGFKLSSDKNENKTTPSKRQTVFTPAVSRRTFVMGAIGTTVLGVGSASIFKLDRKNHLQLYPVRPPGSVPETLFRQQCVSCGNCIKACPVNILQPASHKYGLDALWTPVVNANIAGCQTSCNNCTQVCPTGAIRKISLEEKQALRMGLAQVNTVTCLAHSQTEQCGMCWQACSDAGHDAIDLIEVGTQYDTWGMPIAGTGFLAPVINKDKCVGCGACQAMCHAVNVKEYKALEESAVTVIAGPKNEDRIAEGSYIQLRNERLNTASQQQSTNENTIKIKDQGSDYLPDFLQ